MLIYIYIDLQNKSFILSKSGNTFCNLRSLFVNDSIWSEEIGLGLSTPSILPPGLKSHDIVVKTAKNAGFLARAGFF